MSDAPDHHRQDSPARPQRTVATFRKGWWPGWIWGVPVAAVGVVLWLSLRALSSGGTDITVIFDQAAGMSPGSTNVTYRGLQVGSLEDVHLDSSGQHVVATFNIDDSVERWLDTGTRFYLEGAKPSLSDPASLKAIISGPDIVMVPDKGKPARRFIGIIGEPPQPLNASVSYGLKFDGSVGDLSLGAPVVLRGFTVGDVTAVQLEVNPQTGEISTPVRIVLDPTRFHLGEVTPADGNWTPLMNATLARLVGKGLRASLSRSPPVIGGEQVVLSTDPDAPPATLVAEGDTLLIPTRPATDGPAQLLAKIDQLPIDRIGDNVLAVTQNARSLTARVNELAGSPKLQASIDHLDRTLAALDKTVHEAGPQVAPTIRSLRQTADQIQATAQSVQTLTGGGPAAPDGNLQQALEQLTRAARAMRSLADYLDRHPDALIRGR